MRLRLYYGEEESEHQNEQNIRTDGEHGLRKIPSSVEEKALSLWLQGNAYRSITNKLRISLGVLTRIVNDKKKSVPDLEELRKLNVLLSKSDSSVYDAVKGAKLLNKVNELGIDLERLEEFINIGDKISSEHNVKADKFIDSAIRLTELETRTGKPYHEIVREFDDKQARVNELDLKVKELNSEWIRIQRELGQAKEKLSKTLEELKRATGCQDRLQRLELHKINALAEFIEDYELLGFNAQEVQRLAEWRRSLKATGIDPDGLESFIKRKGTLKKQLQEVETELTEGKARLKILSRLERDLQRRVEDIQRIEHILQSRMHSFACPRCGGVTWREIRRFEVSQCLAMGQPIIIPCQKCMTPNTYNPYEVLARLGFEVLS